MSDKSAVDDANVFRVTPADLPICCPTFAQQVWNQHPRVYIELSADHPLNTCPYCGNRFRLDTRES